MYSSIIQICSGRRQSAARKAQGLIVLVSPLWKSPVVVAYTGGVRMKVVLLSGAIVGTRTRSTLREAQKVLTERYPDVSSEWLDLAQYDVQFSDGRTYWDYEFTSDTRHVAKTVLEADALIVASPIYQASMPAPLKNVFDLLPRRALRDTVASLLINAGSARHYLVPEQQFKPVLGYLGAQIVQHYVYVEDQDFDDEAHIVNPNVLLRIRRLVEDTVALANLYRNMREETPVWYEAGHDPAELEDNP